MHEKRAVKYVPLIITLCVIPLLVQITVTDCGLSGYGWFSENGTEYDFFLIYKMYGIIITAFIMLMMMVFRFCKPVRIGKTVLFCLILYAVLSILSALCAHSRTDAFFGGYAQHEPVTVLVSYVIIFIYTCHIFDDKKAVLIFVRIAVSGAFVMALTGVLQWIGLDFFTSYGGKLLISLFSSISPSQISSSFGGGRVYMTLYNPDYAGVYAVLMLPVCLAGMAAVKDVWFKIVSAVTAVMLIICIIGSGSEAAACVCIVSVAAVAVICVIIYRRMAGVVLLSGMIISVAAVIIFTCVNNLSEKSIYPFEYMNVADDGAHIRIRGQNLTIKSNMGSGSAEIEVYDADMDMMELDNSENIYKFKQDTPEYEGLYFETGISEEGLKGFYVIYGDIRLFFSNDNTQGKYYYRNYYGKYTDDISNIKNDNVLRFKDDFASHRGYIWSAAIPLIKSHIFIGCGPDNFIYEFPNNDYLSLLNNGYNGSVVTRPHNMYLQIAVQTGLLSLAAIIILYAVYFIGSIKIIREMKNISGINIVCIAVFAGTAGYMICGISNDASVCTTPLFWVMLAAGYCCNNIIKKGEKA